MGRRHTDVNRKRHMVVLFLCLVATASWLLTACLGWEDVGEGVAKGQATAEVELSEQGTVIARGVATAVESYKEERERQGQPTCSSAVLPVLFMGMAAAGRGYASTVQHQKT